MRQATLYTVQRTKILIREGQEWYDHWRCDPFKSAPMPRDYSKGVQICDETVTKESIPINYIREVEEDFNTREQKVTEAYIAIEPKLELLLNAPIRGVVDSLRYDLNIQKQRFQKQISELENRITTFKSLPWWKRIVKAIKGEI